MLRRLALLTLFMCSCKKDSPAVVDAGRPALPPPTLTGDKLTFAGLEGRVLFHLDDAAYKVTTFDMPVGTRVDFNGGVEDGVRPRSKSTWNCRWTWPGSRSSRSRS